MKQGISVIVGQAALADGGSSIVYRALRPLLCSQCGATIGENELFTRWQFPGQEMRIMPRCLKCAPFQLNSQKDEGEKKRSEIIEALLASPQDTPPEPSNHERRKLDDAIEQRLGPALARTRRLRKFKT